MWLILLIVMIVVLSFLPFIELILLPVGLAVYVGNKYNSCEPAFWTLIISLAVLFGVYYSKAGSVISAVFSLFWGVAVGIVVYKEIGWSILSAIILGIIAFLYSLGVHEYYRSKKAVKQEDSQHQA